MSENFINAIKNETNVSITENGARAYKTTNSDLLDLFATIGALRSRPSQEIINKFTKAFAEDNLLAMKILFYARDIRGGLGERKTFRTIVNYMAQYHSDILEKNIELIPVYGRYDDLYELVGTKLEDSAFKLLKTQFEQDLINLSAGKSVSLLAKWLKNPEGVSITSMKLGKITAKKFGMSYKEYRQSLSKLRKHLNVLERNMSLNTWDNIDYSKVPGQAMKKYKKAFKLHRPETFKTYIEKVLKGEETIKAATLFPYDLMHAAGLSISYRTCNLDSYDDVIQAQWNALPNYVEGNNNIMIMADTSASMNGNPIESALGLAVYFAERNKGVYANKFMTFSESPSFVDLKGSNLKEKINCVPSIVANTNIEAAFDLILETAVNNKISQEDLPKALVIISDMEFDNAQGYYAENFNKQNTLMQTIAEKYEAQGYSLPKIIYWNVDARQDTYHAITTYKNVAMVSGHSTVTFKNILRAIDEDAYGTMLKTLNQERYEAVRV